MFWLGALGVLGGDRQTETVPVDPGGAWPECAEKVEALD